MSWWTPEAFWLGFACGGCLVLIAVGVALWKLYTEIAREKRAHQREPEPICGCGHHRSFHDAGKSCHYIHKGTYSSDDYTCGCTIYIGPPAFELMS